MKLKWSFTIDNVSIREMSDFEVNLPDEDSLLWWDFDRHLNYSYC